LTVDQAAERLNVPVGYVRRRLIFERRIPYVKIGRHVRIESQVVEALIEAGRMEPQEVASASGRPQLSIAEIREEELKRWRTSASTR
jgi:excisionase family DNA binding protein